MYLTLTYIINVKLYENGWLFQFHTKTSERIYMKLSNYIANTPIEITHFDNLSEKYFNLGLI